jgi:phosphoglycolate phosphatase-like HAD superfamily hydrolase
MLAIAFAADDVLAPTAPLRRLAATGTDPQLALAAVQELVRPLPGAPRVLRELEALGVGLALLGAQPAELLRRIAQVVFFRGEVVAAEGPGRFAALAARFGLPEACIWYVTAAAGDAAEARAAGANVILVDPDAARCEPQAAGFVVVPAVDDVLEVIRIPYTRSALNLRYILRKIMDTPPLDELVR